MLKKANVAMLKEVLRSRPDEVYVTPSRGAILGLNDDDEVVIMTPAEGQNFYTMTDDELIEVIEITLSK